MVIFTYIVYFIIFFSFCQYFLKKIMRNISFLSIRLSIWKKQRDEIEIIRRTNCEFDPLETEGSRRAVRTVDMTEIAGGDPVFLEKIYDLSANESTPYGREMKKDKNGKRFS